MITNPNSRSAFTPSRWRRIFCSVFLIAAAVAGIGAIASSRLTAEALAKAGAVGGSTSPKAMGQRVEDNAFHLAPANKIAPLVMEHTTNGQQAEFFVVLADQADLSGAASLPTKAEKGRFVYETLLSKAQTTQEPILQWLRDRAIEHQSFYIVNAILVRRPARMWREWKAIRLSTMTCLNLALSKNRHLTSRPQSNQGSVTPTRHRYGPWDSPGKIS